LPASLVFVSASGGGTTNAGVVTWNLGRLPTMRPQFDRDRLRHRRRHLDEFGQPERFDGRPGFDQQRVAARNDERDAGGGCGHWQSGGGDRLGDERSDLHHFRDELWSVQREQRWW